MLEGLAELIDSEVRPDEVNIILRARTPQEVIKILKRQPRVPPRDKTGRSRAGRQVP